MPFFAALLYPRPRRRDQASLGATEISAQSHPANGVISGYFSIIVLLIAALFVLPPSAANAGVHVLTSHNDHARLGVNNQETNLTPATVSSGNFGKVFSYPVDGYVYAQPLVLSGVTLPDQTVRNLVFVATEHDSLYAFDGDSQNGTNNGVVWHVSFINPAAGVTTMPSGDTGSGDIVPEIGITATPVIDADAGVIYVEVKTKEKGQYIHRLHALDVRTGEEMPNSPVLITATVKGSGDGSSGGNLPFNGQRQMARPGLSLVKTAGFTNPVVYIAYASHGDNGPYHGWVLGYDSKTLQQVHVYNATPNGGLGGFWMAGNGPAFDSDGSIYLITGNGTYNSNGKSFGDSYVKLVTANTNLVQSDWFTPFNQNDLNNADADLGSGGNIVLPDSAGSAAHPHLLVGCGKDGVIHLLDRDNMGKFNSANDNQTVQALGGVINGTWSSPAYYKGRLYYQGSGDVLKSLVCTNARISGTVLSQSRQGFGYPGATPSISANNNTNGIAWVLQTDGYGSRSPAVLHAYDAENLQTELYSSAALSSRDNPGPAVKYTVPTVANGRVYVGSANALAVYGTGNWVAKPTLNPPGGQFSDFVIVTITDATPGATIYYTTDGNDPTPQSSPYTGPITVTNTLAIRARAYANNMFPSSIASGTFLSPGSVGTGIGLEGDYYSNQNMTFNGTPTLSRYDSQINFDWGGGSPDPAISADHFTARWTGQIKAQFSEPYTFYLTGDDGIRLWVNGQPLVNAWVDQGPTEYSGTINLLAGQRYDIRVEYYENGGGAVCKLEWSSPSTLRQYIPTSQLYPPIPPNLPPTVSWTSPAIGSTVAGPASIFLAASAGDSDGKVASVTFYNGSNPIAQLSNAPYAFTWTKVQPGNYTLYAVATDNGGAKATNVLSGIQVTQGTGARFGMNSRPMMAAYLGLPQDNQTPFPELLSQTGTFGDLPTLATATGLIAYGVNAPFWSDGAFKRRWMGVPYSGGPILPAQQVNFSSEAPWQFPVGSVFVKNFDLQTNELDPQAIRRLETRLLVNLGNGVVYGATYKWRPDLSEADLVVNANSEEIPITTASGSRIQTWYYPSSSDCVVCHTPISGGILGASKTRQLNGPWLYEGSQVTDNQLRTLNYLGLLNPPLDEALIPAFNRFYDVGETNISASSRARSFLDVNCSYCHQPGGVRGLFDARITASSSTSGIINGPLVNAGSIPGTKVLVPGDELRSMLYQRALSLDPLIKMPPIARNEVDWNAIGVMGKWIDQLAGPVPRLSATPGQGVLRLSWPSALVPFYLEISDAQGGLTRWIPGPAATIVNGRYTVDVPVSPNDGAAGFHRLTSQQPLP